MTATEAGLVHQAELGELFGALAKAQGQMKTALKDSANPFFKSKYADLTSVWEACREALSANGLSVVQFPINDGELAGMKTILGHSSGAFLESVVFTKTEKAGAQALGSALTYLRRYALAAAVGVTADDDDGNAANGRAEGKAHGPQEEAGKPSVTSAVGTSQPTTKTAPNTHSAAPPKVSADPNPKASIPAPAAEPRSAGTVTATTATSASSKTTTTSAASIKHDGNYITPGQLKVLHITRREVGGQYCTDGGKDEDDERSLWRSKVLGVYRDMDGSRIKSSQQLSKAQANHLIDRLTRYQAKTRETLAARDAGTNVADIIPINRDPPSLEASLAISGALKTKQMDAQELCAIFGVDDVTEISASDADKALALVFAYDTPNFGRILAEVGQVPR